MDGLCVRPKNKRDMRKILSVILMTFLTLTTWAAAKTNLRVLYVGGHADIETIGEDGLDSAVVAKSVASRTAAWKSFLETYFTTVKVIQGKDYDYKMSNDYDVTIIDGNPKPIIPRQYVRKNGRIVKVVYAKYFPDNFNRPVLTIADEGETVGRRLGVKNDWYCLCLAGHAFNIHTDNAIFKGPYPVHLTMTDRPTPDGAKEFAIMTGDKLPLMTSMWKVQTEDYMTKPHSKIGMVTREWGYTDSPDAEVISGGECAKSYDAIAIGRHANFLSWGFAASPAYLTEEAKPVLLNAIIYISKFAGHHVIARKLNENIATSDDIRQSIGRVKPATYESYKETVEKSNVMVKHYADSVKAVRDAGGKITAMDEQYIMMAEHPQEAPTYEQFLQRVAGELYAKFGTDTAAYAKYYTDNAPYFYGTLDDYGLKIDEDAKSLGLKVGSFKLLDKAISLWEKGKDVDMAKRILYHYTLLRYDNAKAFRDWYKKYEKKIFFTESGGWLYLVNDLDPKIPGNDYSVLHYNDVPEEKPELTQAATKMDPVTISAMASEGDKDGEKDIVIRVNIYPGFHIYDIVSEQDPYIQNEYNVQLEGNYEKVGDLKKPNGQRLGMTGTIVYSGDNIFHQTIKGSGQGKATFTIKYQACDDHSCLMPTEKTVTVDLK